jgi:CRISPR-associated endonuclease Csn1
MLILGLDCGIASVGWAVLEFADNFLNGRIVACGVYCFNQPIVGGTGNDKYRSIQSAKKSFVGGMRYRKRRVAKMDQLRSLLHSIGALPSKDKNAIAEAASRISPKGRSPQITPYDLRTASLKRKLTADEFSVVVAHLVNHPGPRPSEKTQSGSNEPEKGKIKSAVEANSQYAQKGYQTIGEMLATDPDFHEQKRNREMDYKYSVGRAAILDELQKIFEIQSKLGNTFANTKTYETIRQLIQRRKEPKFDYFPVGDCRYIAGQKRAASRSPSFERFRFAQSLAHISLVRDGPVRPTPAERTQAMDEFGKRPEFTFSQLRKLWKLDDTVTFENLKLTAEKTLDVSASKGNGAHGTFTLNRILGAAWDELSETPGLLDAIAYEISFATKESVLAAGLQNLGVKDVTAEALMTAYRNSEFDLFVKSADISAQAAALLTNHLLAGKNYAEACKAEEWDHTAKPVSIQENHNPVTKHALKQYLATISEVVARHGQPDSIHVEMARDVAWSETKKLEYETEINKNKSKWKKLSEQFESKLGYKPEGSQLEKFRLAEEQGYFCIYSGLCLMDEMRAQFVDIEIEHVLPESRFHLRGDKRNLVVCLKGQNANKRNSTPFEWSQRDENFNWDTFCAGVNTKPQIPKSKKRFLLAQDTSEMEQKFAARNLVDTQYAIKLLNAELDAMFSAKGNEKTKPRIVGRPGRLVSWLRKSWGLNHLKFDAEGNRRDDRNHAVDAIVVACINDRTLQIATRFAKLNEESGRPRHNFEIEKPGVLEQVQAAIDGISIVARERQSGYKGSLHKETTYGLSEVDGQLKIRERVAVNNKLTLKHLERFRDSSDKGYLKTILLAWVKGGHKGPHPEWKYGTKPDGTEDRRRIKKITLITNHDPQVVFPRLTNSANGKPQATYARGDMVRVDVFESVGTQSNSKYLFVPIYPYQMNLDAVPNQYFKRGVQPADWPALHVSDKFVASLFKLDLVEISTKNGKQTYYYRGLHSNNGGSFFSPVFSLLDAAIVTVFQTHVLGLKKLRVSRAGEILELVDEGRIWRGKVCM